LVRREPDLVFMPHGNDSNADHRRTYRLFSQMAPCLKGQEVRLLLNWDPKTLGMRVDILSPFREEEAQWKRELLRFHRSQHQRNLSHRGHGFDDRILLVNRRIAIDCGLDLPYAEAFEEELLSDGQLSRKAS